MGVTRSLFTLGKKVLQRHLPAYRGRCYHWPLPWVFKGPNNWCHFVLSWKNDPVFPNLSTSESTTVLTPLPWQRAFCRMKQRAGCGICHLALLISVLLCYVGRVLTIPLTAVMSASQGSWIKDPPTWEKTPTPNLEGASFLSEIPLLQLDFTSKHLSLIVGNPQNRKAIWNSLRLPYLWTKWQFQAICTLQKQSQTWRKTKQLPLGANPEAFPNSLYSTLGQSRAIARGGGGDRGVGGWRADIYHKPINIYHQLLTYPCFATVGGGQLSGLHSAL